MNNFVSPFDLETLTQIANRATVDSRSTAELVPWLFKFNDHTICNKDSALMVTYEFFGPDSDSMTEDDLRRLVENVIKGLRDLSRYPCAVWWTVHRRRMARYRTRPIANEIAQMIDDERRKAFDKGANYLNRHYVTFTLRPNVGLDRFVGRVAHAVRKEGASLLRAVWHAVRGTFSSQYSFAYSQSELQSQVDDFETQIQGFVSSNPDLNCRRIANTHLGAFMHAVANPAADSQPRVNIPHTPALDAAMVSGEVIPGEDFLYFYSAGRRRFGIAAAIPTQHDFWPDETTPRSLDGLLKVPGEITISHMFEIASRSKASRIIERIRSYHEGRKLNKRALIAASMNGGEVSTARESEARSEAAKAAQKSLGKVEMGQEIWGHYNLTVMAYSPAFDDSEDPANFRDRTFEAYQQAVKTFGHVDEALRNAGFTPIRETIGALSAWTSTIPGMWREVSRRAFIDTEVLARLLPLRGVHRGESVNKHLTKETGEFCPALAMFATDYGTPFGFTGFLDDIGHMIVSGRTGYGKTIFLILCATLFRKYPNAWIIGFDKNGSLRIPTLLQGGQYIHISPEDVSDETRRTKINPISLLGEDRHFEFLVTWIKGLAAQRGYQPVAKDEENIQTALRATRNISRKLWRLRAVWESLPDPSRLREELAPYVGDGAQAIYFDNVDDGFDMSDMVVAETEKILKNETVARPMLSYLFYRIKDRMEQRRQQGIIGPTVLLLPEVWNLTKNAQFAEELNDMIVTWRKLLGCIWMDAQSPEQIFKSPLAAAVRDNVPTRVLVPVEQVTPGLLKACEEYGINSAQVSAIQRLTPKRDYFISQSNGFSRRIRVELDPRTIAALRSETRAQVLLDKHMNSGNPNWREAYLDEAVRRAAELAEKEEEENADVY